jgi:hypothetical protein
MSDAHDGHLWTCGCALSAHSTRREVADCLARQRAEGASAPDATDSASDDAAAAVIRLAFTPLADALADPDSTIILSLHAVPLPRKLAQAILDAVLTSSGNRYDITVVPASPTQEPVTPAPPTPPRPPRTPSRD